MENVTVENFIQDYLIKQIGEVKACHPYFAFALIAIGIEFLGKCQNSYTDWNYYKHSQPEKDFISHVFHNLKMLLGCDVVCVSCLGRWELGAGRMLGCVDDVMGGGGGAL